MRHEAIIAISHQAINEFIFQESLRQAETTRMEGLLGISTLPIEYVNRMGTSPVKDISREMLNQIRNDPAYLDRLHYFIQTLNINLLKFSIRPANY